MPAKFLIPREKYLESGVHIGMKQRTKQMEDFIYKIRPDGLAVLNLRVVDERIHVAAKFLARAKRIIVVSRKSVAQSAVKKFADLVGAKVVLGRFMPGTLTNPNYRGFYEADVLFITDPLVDYQALEEAIRAHIPVVAVCDTFNETADIDMIIPANNKGKKALATVFWLLAREILKERGKVESDEAFKTDIEDFMR